MTNEPSCTETAGPKVGAGIVLLLLSHLYASAAAAGGSALDILLTNDDGFESPGLTVLADALRTVGHRVTIVAPRTQQSGTGAHVSFAEVQVERVSDSAWSVDGTPADAVLIGLQAIFRSSPPDLLLSGPNFGQNLGQNIVNSGTVGAAMMAVQEGVPAIALSVGIDLRERRAEPEHYPSTRAAFPRAAIFTVRLIAELVQRRRETGQLLPPGLLLNVNYPHVPPHDMAGVRIVPVGRYGGFRLLYPKVTGSSQVRTQFAYDERGFDDDGRDTAFFRAGFTTISVVEPPWPVVPAYTAALERWLAAALLSEPATVGPAKLTR